MQVKSCQRRWTVRMGTRGSSPRSYKQNRVMSPGAREGRGPWIIPGWEVWWSPSQGGHTDTARWWHHIDGVKDGRTDGQSGRGILWTADMEGVQARLWSVVTKWSASKSHNLPSNLSHFRGILLWKNCLDRILKHKLKTNFVTEVPLKFYSVTFKPTFEKCNKRNH